jgi:aspartate-semialdehyde dehydrogenase
MTPRPRAPLPLEVFARMTTLAAGAASLPADAEPWRALVEERAYVAGRWVGADEAVEVTDPAWGRLVGRAAKLPPARMREAIAAASDALPAWRSLLPRERGDLLMEWRRLMLERADDLAALMSAEQGKPHTDARGEILYGAEFVRWFAEEASRAYGEVIPSHLKGCKLTVQREPVGVVGLVTPWNFPSAMLARKASAALAAGCTAIAVPSMETPFSALALARLAEAAGFPPGVFSVLTGDAEALVGEICRSPAVRAVSFTGSTRVGRLIAAQCALTLKRLTLELGGHAPFLVFADADIELAAEAAVAAKFQTSGQDCLAANRIYVHADVHEAFLDAFVRRAAQLKTGPVAGADLGPLTTRAAFEKSAEHVADALAKGARLALGGAPQGRGLFFPPTVLAGVTADMKIATEETFGPVAAILPFRDEAAVVNEANSTEYGLVAYLFTRDLSRAHRVSDALAFGMVAINTARLTGAPIPFGGVKQSGLGREGGRHGLEEFTELKYVCLAV